VRCSVWSRHFCSCSAVPAVHRVRHDGCAAGVTFSFLISRRWSTEIAPSFCCWPVRLEGGAIYLSTGLIIALVAAGIGRLRMERYVEDWVYQSPTGPSAADEAMTWPARVRYGLAAVRDIVGRVWLFVVLGIAVGAGIHGYVPEGFMASFMARVRGGRCHWQYWLVCRCIPNAAGIIPIVQALLGKGAALGTVLAFMMSVIGLSLPRPLSCARCFKLPLILTFFARWRWAS